MEIDAEFVEGELGGQLRRDCLEDVPAREGYRDRADGLGVVTAQHPN